MSSLNLSLLEALPASAALLDHDGIIVAANDAWLNSEAHPSRANVSVGSSYIDACDVLASNIDLASKARGVLSGTSDSLSETIAFDNGPGGIETLRIKISHVVDNPAVRAVVTHTIVAAGSDNANSAGELKERVKELNALSAKCSARTFVESVRSSSSE
ncbi:MAG: hypothetical protein H0V76_01215 [Blastocatellia bacterium]|nr:hypothetical protein [Blastocatellia bacterium]